MQHRLSLCPQALSSQFYSEWWQLGAPRPTKMGTTVSLWRYDAAACDAIETPVLQCSAISYCASRQSPERLSPPIWTLLASVLSLAAAV
jgi:hypothetical protein